MKHPIQPLETDDRGVLRFKDNAIVRHLLGAGNIDLDQIAMGPFSKEDHEQFAQLIGYSLSGFGELSYVSSETYEAASKMHKDGLTEDKARIADLEETLATVRAGLRQIVPTLFGIHEDDLDA